MRVYSRFRSVSLIGANVCNRLENKCLTQTVKSGLRKQKCKCMAGKPLDIKAGEWSSWYVLTTSNPKHLEDLIAKANAVSPGQYDSFCPYTCLPEQSNETEKNAALSLRTALRRYDFVRIPATVSEQKFVSKVAEWNSLSTNSIFLLRNSNNEPARVPNRQLEVMRASCDAELIKPENIDVRNLKVGQRITLTGTPFGEGDGVPRQCVIRSVRRKRGGRIELRVEMTLFNVKFSNLQVTYEDPGAAGKSSDMVYDAQQKMLAIFRRKINNKETTASRKKDEQTLQEIFAERAVELPEGAMRRHFLALMLICARMLNSKEGISQYAGLVDAELRDLERIRESKAATDSRAWLHIAMFIATGQPHFRNLAKAYIRRYNPKSTYLQQFVKQSCKTAGEKWIGLRKKTKSSIT